ncbi:cell division protein FtsQ/DivIB [Streptomyces hoynatensis]|uniref:Cell division protein FtsQ n=1 Tax=Streptomyces hoynatensis TaxID=1141874 RepID=A0A3A9Z4K6_9ACTN|nr:FtsQ-type POTRA domain-containing protein [Streptomyces hoynatensis]RKN42306.1 FtsQ-type POTRA domain-containing protein [Streptomyces hoynatensis]
MAGATTAQRGTSDRRPAARSRLRLRRRGGGRPRRRLLALLLVSAVALGGFGAWALYGSSWLRIERVSVHWTGGPHELTADQILGAADVPLNSPMASLDKDAVRDRLLERLPRLESVRVVRAWPHGVSLKVTEREAQALIPIPGGYREVDAHGVVFAEAAEALPGVPLLDLDLEPSPSLRRFGEDRIRRAAVSVAVALPEELRGELRAIRVASYDSITLELSGDRTVRWGSAERPEAKVAALLAVMKVAGDARYFDVSAPTAPASAEG